MKTDSSEHLLVKMQQKKVSQVPFSLQHTEIQY